MQREIVGALMFFIPLGLAALVLLVLLIRDIPWWCTGIIVYIAIAMYLIRPATPIAQIQVPEVCQSQSVDRCCNEKH